MNPTQSAVATARFDARPTWPARSVLALLAWALPLSASAKVELSLRLETSLGRNSNLFRDDASSSSTPSTPEGPAAPAREPVSTSTRAHLLDLGVGIPLLSDDTRLVLSTRLGSVGFGQAPDLNHRPVDTQARLTWRYSDLLRGEVHAGQSRNPYPFDDTYPRLDEITRRWHMGGITLQVTPELEVPLLLGSERAEYRDRDTHGRLDVDRQHASAGLMYRSPTGSTAQIGVARARYTYPQRLTTPEGQTAFNERNTDFFVDVLWNASVVTQMGGRIASRQRRDNLDTSSPSRSMVYRLWAGHALSPLWRVDVQWWHQPIEVTDPAVASAQIRGSGIGVTWTPSHRLTTSLQFQRDQQSDDLLPGQSLGDPLDPRTRRTQLRVQYRLDSGLSLFAEATREQRTRRVSDQASQSVFRIGVDYTYENLSGAAARNARPVWPFQ